jgi:hypothetical protein
MLGKVLPWIAATAAGAAAYKYLRTPTFSTNRALRKIQEAASSKGFHRVVNVTPGSDRGFMDAVVDSKGELSPWNKMKMFLNEGTTEAIPVYTAGNKTRIAGHKGPMTVKGVVHSGGDIVRHGRSALVRGGTDIEGSLTTQRVMDRFSRRGKGYEADLLQRYAPGAMPETFTNLSAHLKGLPSDRQQAIKEFQRRVVGAHGSDVMLKPVMGLTSGGEFPYATGRWGARLARYDKHFLDPKNRRAWRTAQAGGGNEAADYLKGHGLYQGHVLSEAMKDPKSVLAQRLIDKPLNEWRVHTVAGTAPTSMMDVRFVKGPMDAAKAIPGYVGGNRDMQKFVEKTLAKLPKKYRGGNYGVDVMKYVKPDGSIGHKIIEMNPTELATATKPGGASGFLETHTAPLIGHMHYRTATGRHTPLLAGLGAVGAAGAAGLGTAGAIGSAPADKAEGELRPREVGV